ncbi:MAG: hypothetical protein U9O20_03270 [Patescibacteria group bacterium]|nr:hypothetical protein [Patescibacteria group bacterium]
MKKNKNKKVFFRTLPIFILALILFQGVSFAQAQICPAVREGFPGDIIVFSQSIVPCSRDCDVASTPYNETHQCTLCHLIVMVHNIYNLMVAMLLTVSLFFVTMGGVLYIVSSGNSALRSKAKEIIIKTLIGFALFLLTWLIIYTLLVVISANENALGLGRSGGNWYDFSCDTNSVF